MEWLHLDAALAGAVAIPPGRDTGAFAYDSARSELVLFGGYGTSGPLADTWVFTVSGWAQLHPVTAPTPRYGVSMAFDAANSTDVIFGGYFPTASQSLGDTWTFNGTTWSQASVASPTSPRAAYAMAYDPNLMKVIMFGGNAVVSGVDTVDNDTWAWNGSLWQSAGTIGAPAGRDLMAYAYDTLNQDEIVFGGATITGSGITYVGDTWSYSAQVPTLVVQATPASSAPTLEEGATIQYTAVVANSGLAAMTGVAYADQLTAPLSLQATTLALSDALTGARVACASPCAESVTSASGTMTLQIALASIPAVDGLVISYDAVISSAGSGCGPTLDAASAANAFGTATAQASSAGACAQALGVEPWYTFVNEPLGPQSTAKVNVADGNLWWKPPTRLRCRPTAI